eukprot:COSAG05_NODE_4158_length_1647_cov_54.791990_2_plen_308_part_00
MPVHSRPDTLIPDGADASIYHGASPDTSRQPPPAAGAMTDAETSSLLEGTDAGRIDELDCAQQSVRRSPRRTSEVGARRDSPSLPSAPDFSPEALQESRPYISGSEDSEEEEGEEPPVLPPTRVADVEEEADPVFADEDEADADAAAAQIETVVVGDMSVADLKEELKRRGLAQSGRKQQLLDRLVMALGGIESFEGDPPSFQRTTVAAGADAERMDGLGKWVLVAGTTQEFPELSSTGVTPGAVAPTNTDDAPVVPREKFLTEPAERIVRPELKARNGGGRGAPPEQGGPSAAMKLGTTAEPWDFM